MPLLDDIATHLTNAGIVGGATGWDIFKSGLDEDGDKAVSVIESGGGQPDADASGAIEHDFPSFQIMVRGDVQNYEPARTKMEEIFNSLHDATITNFIYVFANQSPLDLGPDANNRPQIALNFSTMRTRNV